MDDIPADLIEDLIAEYKEAFLALSTEPGFITKKDFERLLFTLNQKPTQQELTDLMMTIDPEQQDKISFVQFIKLLVVIQRSFDREEALRAAFLCFDRNGDGNLGSSEIFYVLKQLGIQVTKAEVEELLQEYGGVIGFEQFCRVFGRLEL